MLKHKLLMIALSSCLLLSACSGNSTTNNQTAHRTNSVMRPHITYTESSEKRPYPSSVNRNDRIIVSKAEQRAYLQKPAVKNGHFKTIYEFYVSTGKNVKGRRTPSGTYHINGVHSKWFYSPSEHEGAHNGVGFHDGGEYLFHETPSYQNGKVIKPVARELGKKGTSYGCVHLTQPDSQWFYTHIPNGLKVIIR